MTAIAGGLIDLEYAKAGVKYTGVNVARDADLTVYVQAATAVIEDIVGAVLQRSVTKMFAGGKSSVLLNEKATAITKVLEKGNPLRTGDQFADLFADQYGAAISDYTYDPDSCILYAGTADSPRYFYPGTTAITVTYTVGWAIVPPTIQLATRELVRFWVQQGGQSQRPSFGDGVEASAFTPQGFAVPKRVMELCAPYRTLGGFA